METRLSTKGQVVLPAPFRRRLGIRAGDRLDARIEDGRIVLAPKKKPASRARIIKDPVLGIPVLTFGAGAPTLTSEEVRKALADFP
jgi:AbrB family looped-hinge helix DNA binding protein